MNLSLNEASFIYLNFLSLFLVFFLQNVDP